ncbi:MULTISPECIES: DedA family protein [Xenorhabdus]|uniref:DedA protein n=1 Tax=Xenorhabdus stockiae TaxID=351614 RepID=A0A2D0KS95_9GAMM|nr:MULTISPECIES: DedA family protein [Xenorhabdus]MCC8367390.1 DedA family protein [Xenorhabdus sp. PB61.4]MCC8381143.1 DedA family protein [Xenorhabdus sp. PB30.3]PHM58840.1 DedA protein [Xenorhabdus sp. KK7.4]PHM66301.1 DedA protein [Xenorhabdus stockiae]PHM71972.1 DedA protein [Xenorhabdus sp. KJ12.1]
METLSGIVQALWQHDFTLLANPDVIWIIYGVIFVTLVLENGLLPAAFLPGDTLLILTGALIAKGVMGFVPTVILLTIAASLGCWLGYLQGRWLGHTRMIKNWLAQLPAEQRQRANVLFAKHGLTALLIGRFLAFIRTLLPTFAGISGLNSKRFQFFNWLSGFLWVIIIVSFGYALNQIPFVKAHQDLVMNILMILPVILLISGLGASLLMYWRHKKASSHKNK